MDSNEIAQILCKIIAYAGDSKSAALEAMDAARAFKFEPAEELITRSNESLLTAQKIQLELIRSEARGEDIKVSMLMMHTISIFTAAEVSNDFAKQYIELCALLNNRSNGG